MHLRNQLRLASTALLAVALSSACAPPDDVPEELQQEIIGGSRIPGQMMGVVFIIARNGSGQGIFVCSGSLLTSRVVMTAAHCADGTSGDVSYEVHFADKYDRMTGDFIGQIDDIDRNATVKWVHPQYAQTSSSPAPNKDIALLYLDTPAPASAPPLEYGRYRLGDFSEGERIRFIGFGNTVFNASSYGEKLHGFSTIETVAAEFFDSNDAQGVITCQGDSGGPVLMTIEGREVIVGITSVGLIGCAGSASYTRVDAHRQHVKAFIAEHDPQPAGGCGDDGICGFDCPAVDPDCPCVGDTFCTTDCTTPDLDPDCPMNCGADTVCRSAGCPVKDPDCGDKLTGTACVANNECATGLCVGTASKVCADACSAAAPCGSGFVCRSGACLEDEEGGGGGCAVAASAPPSSGAGALGGWLALGMVLLLGRRYRASVR